MRMSNARPSKPTLIVRIAPLDTYGGAIFLFAIHSFLSNASLMVVHFSMRF